MPGPPPKDVQMRVGNGNGAKDSRNDVETPALPPWYDPNAPVENPDWHPYAQAWFRALKLSPQSGYYTEIDWMTAYLAGDMLDVMVSAGWYRIGTMLQEWNSITERLLCTIGDRRRMRIQFIRAGGPPQDADEDASADELAAWRDRLNKSGEAQAS